jgi:hypothetical protein
MRMGGLLPAAWVILATGTALLGWAAWHSPGTAVFAAASGTQAAPAKAAPYPVDSLGQIVVTRDLFRASRRPAPIAYDPVRGAQPVVADAAPKPVLLLVGIVTGAEPTAVIEGFPGVDGARVVRAGDVVAGLRVKHIGGGVVRIVGMDTVWVLSVRQPWK